MNLLKSSTIPVLEQVANFSQARHNILAGNIANIDTPHYVARDLSVTDFQSRLKSAIEADRQPPLNARALKAAMAMSAGTMNAGTTNAGAVNAGSQIFGSYNAGPLNNANTGSLLAGPPGAVSSMQDSHVAHVADQTQSILYHDRSNVGEEYQVNEMVKNRMQFNLAVALLSQQFRLLQAAISERA